MIKPVSIVAALRFCAGGGHRAPRRTQRRSQRSSTPRPSRSTAASGSRVPAGTATSTCAARAAATTTTCARSTPAAAAACVCAADLQDALRRRPHLGLEPRRHLGRRRLRRRLPRAAPLGRRSVRGPGPGPGPGGPWRPGPGWDTTINVRCASGDYQLQHVHGRYRPRQPRLRGASDLQDAVRRRPHLGLESRGRLGRRRLRGRLHGRASLALSAASLNFATRLAFAAAGSNQTLSRSVEAAREDDIGDGSVFVRAEIVGRGCRIEDVRTRPTIEVVARSRIVGIASSRRSDRPLRNRSGCGNPRWTDRRTRDCRSARCSRALIRAPY